jgi:hypothetical protein
MGNEYGFRSILGTSDIQGSILRIALGIIGTLLHSKQLTRTQNSQLDLILGFVLTHCCLFLQLKFSHWINLDFLDDLIQLLEHFGWLRHLELTILDQVHTIRLVIGFVNYVTSLQGY